MNKIIKKFYKMNINCDITYSTKIYHDNYFKTFSSAYYEYRFPYCIDTREDQNHSYQNDFYMAPEHTFPLGGGSLQNNE